MTINAHFRIYTGMVNNWSRRYEGVVGARAAIEARVGEWYEQQFSEVILGARNLAGSPHWRDEDVNDLLSPRSLTTAVLPRVAVALHQKKSLGQQLGRG